MNFLITGGAGFIGSALIRFLIRETDHEVLNLDKLTYASNLTSLASVSANPRYRFQQLDTTDAPAVSAAIESFQPDRIIHLAAESHVDRSVDSPAEFIQTNIVGSYTLLNAACHYWQQHEKADFLFHHVSSDEVFGSLGATGYFTEENTLCTEFTLLGQQGIIRPSGSCLGHYLWTACRYHQLCKQLWPVPVPGKTDPAHDHECSGGKTHACLRQGG